MDQQVASNRIIGRLPADEAALLLPHLHSLDLQQGQHLARAGSEIEQVVFPQSGVICIVVTLEDGTAVEAAMIGSESVLDAPLTASGLGKSVNDAIVQVPGTAQAVAFGTFCKLIEDSPVLREEVARCHAVLLAQAQQSAACNAMHAAEARICRWLLELQDRCDDVIPMTQEYLSEMLGLQRTTVTLIASRLQAIDAIRCRRGKISVLDRKALERGACECYGRMLRTSQLLLQGAKPATSGFHATPAGEPASRQDHALIAS